MGPVTGVSMSVAPARTTGQRGLSPVQMQDYPSQQSVPFLAQGLGGLQTPPSVSGNAWRPVPHVEKPGAMVIPPGQGPRSYVTSYVPATYGQHASIVQHQWAYNQPGTGQTYMRPTGGKQFFTVPPFSLHSPPLPSAWIGRMLFQ